MHVLDKLDNNNLGGFNMTDGYAWSNVWADEKIKDKLVDIDSKVLDMSIREISNLLGEQYEKNISEDIPVAALIMRGFNIQTGKKMCLQVLLIEDKELEEIIE